MYCNAVSTIELARSEFDSSETAGLSTGDSGSVTVSGTNSWTGSGSSAVATTAGSGIFSSILSDCSSW